MALLPALFVLTLAAAVAVGAAVVRRSPSSSETTVAAARRHARLTSTAAVVLAAAAAVGTAVTGWLGGSGPSHNGVTALLVPVSFGVVHTVVLALGELAWPRPDGQVRRARLVRRGPLDAAPHWLVRLAAGALGVAVLTIGLGALLADPDGRSFSYTSPDGRMAGAASPFVGLAYGRPAAIGLLVLSAAAVAALWIVANRPAVATEDDRIEAALRRASAHRVLRGAAAVLLVVTGGLLIVSGLSVSNAATGALTSDALSALGKAVAVLGALVGLGGFAVLAVRAPGVPADQPSDPVPATS